MVPVVVVKVRCDRVVALSTLETLAVDSTIIECFSI